MLNYRVKVLPNEHALAVEMSVEATSDEIFLEVPTWVPGAYAFMRYGRDIVDVSAVDAVSGSAVAVERRGWNAFRISAGKKSVKVTYKVFVVDAAWGELVGIVGTDQAVLLATRLLFVRGEQSAPCRVTYDLPEKWAFHHPSGAKKIGERTYEYPNYEVLLDTPVVSGAFDKITRTISGTPFHFIFLERATGFAKKSEELVDALVRVSAACEKIFGAFPFDDYSFVMSSDPRAHWGLEHANATMIGIGEDVFVDPEARLQCIRVAGHELVHAWNVKRLKPKPIRDLDLSKGSFTDGLWVAEGFTRYWEMLIAVRANEMSPARFFSNVVNYYRYLAARPAYARTSPSDSSRATFLNHHRYPGAWNSSVDYYDAGMLVAFDIDATLRRAKAPSSLDESFVAFYNEFLARGFSGADARAFFASRDSALEPLLAREVDGAGALSTIEQLEAIGFEVTRDSVPRAGLVLEKNIGPRILDVLEGSAAAAAGLAPDDEIVKLEDAAFHVAGLKWLIKNESTFAITVRRGARFFTFAISPELRADVTKLTWRGNSEDADRLKKWLDREVLDFGPGSSSGAEIPLTWYDNFHGVDAAI
jgi:predicted metalloprotease with PDZ domain